MGITQGLEYRNNLQTINNRNEGLHNQLSDNPFPSI